MRIIPILILINLLISAVCYGQGAEFSTELDEFFEEEHVLVTLASGVEERLVDAPAAMIVITEKDIRQRGYTSLEEIFSDLPGFDISFPNGANYINIYQRGYRTPLMQRTLLMLDGIVVDNHLWTHVAEINRQYPLSNIKRIEILYGPASAVYGPNAFLGIINLVTEDGRALADGVNIVDVNMQAGSFNTRAIDVGAKGKMGDLTYSLSGKIFRSDEPDLSNKWGFLQDEMYKNETIWGPMLEHESRDEKLGKYADPSDNYGTLGSIGFKDVKIGWIHWQVKEGYGVQYPADRVQNNASWNKRSSQIYLNFTKEIEENFKTDGFLAYRENRLWGTWVEALPDAEQLDYSYISYTHWNSVNNSWQLKQNFEYQVNENLLLSGGIKYERKELTKAYDIPGYWGAYSSTMPSHEQGPYGFGAGVGHSSDSIYILPPQPNPEMSSANMTLTEDIGGFAQGIIDINKFRFNMGIRYDENSIYGYSVNPRLSMIYQFSEQSALKFLYGEAFQEPAPIQLWGGWTGRQANPEMDAEKVRNAEIIAMYRLGQFFHDISFYYAHYENVIKEEAENAGERDIMGVEYRLKYTIPNFIPDSKRVSGYLYYTFTDVTSSIYYDHDTQTWQEGDTELGDIAPHKLNVGINLPIKHRLNLNLRGNYVGEKTVYTRNALRPTDQKIDGYVVINGNASYQLKGVTFSIKVLNIFDEEYYHPGIEQADSGDDFSQRSKGFQNSLLPQPGRSFLISAHWTL